MASPRISSLIINVRNFSNSASCYSFRNIRKWPLHGMRGTMEFRKRQKENPDPDIPVYKFGVRDTGYTLEGKFYKVPEMIPELVVPDLTDCNLKPYVSYRAADVVQDEFTALDLFNAMYRSKIESDFLEKKLDENGQPLEPNTIEKMTAEEAKQLSRKPGCDLFTENKTAKYS